MIIFFLSQTFNVNRPFIDPFRGGGGRYAMNYGGQIKIIILWV